MPRRRSKATEAQSEDQSMGNSNSIFSVSDAATEHRTRTASFFGFTGLLVSTKSKGSPESDSTKSPTSPLDFRLFANLGSSLFRSPRSPGRSWDCSRVGLGLVDSLGDETCPRFSENRNVLLGSQKRILSIRSTQNHVSSTQVSSFSATATSRKYFADPEPISGVLGSLPPSEIELSEDYTCIISHGPNPKTTHIFGNCVLESYVIEPPAMDGGRVPSHFRCNEFLRFCFFCNTKLEDNRDIYMYRGEKAFCSWECRDQLMTMEAEKEMDKPPTSRGNAPSAASVQEDLVLEDAFARSSKKSSAMCSMPWTISPVY